MASQSLKNYEEDYKEIKTVLISQPKPERSPYFSLEEKWGIKVDWRSFIHVEPIPAKEFRKLRIYIADYTAIIFTSKNSIEHFFSMCEGMRVKMPDSTKYFCLTEAIANYLQKFIIYRKRKVFVGVRKAEDLHTYFEKHKAKEKFLLPCSNLGAKATVAYLKKNEVDFVEACMYKTVASDLSDLTDITYDALVFFSPLGIESLFINFPTFEQNKTRLAIYGKSTQKAVDEKVNLFTNIKVPSPGVTSMVTGLEQYLEKSNKKT